MFKRNNYWRNLAMETQAKLDAAEAALAIAKQLIADRPVLVKITRDGRLNRFAFMRNNQRYQIETMGTWSDDIAQWEKDLLQ